MPFAAGAFALLVFRLWRRRVAESWPSLGQAALMAFAGAVLAVGGCGGWAATMDTSALVADRVRAGRGVRRSGWRWRSGPVSCF